MTLQMATSKGTLKRVGDYKFLVTLLLLLVCTLGLPCLSSARWPGADDSRRRLLVPVPPPPGPKPAAERPSSLPPPAMGLARLTARARLVDAVAADIGGDATEGAFVLPVVVPALTLLRTDWRVGVAFEAWLPLAPAPGDARTAPLPPPPARPPPTIGWTMFAGRFEGLGRLTSPPAAPDARCSSAASTTRVGPPFPECTETAAAAAAAAAAASFSVATSACRRAP